MNIPRAKASAREMRVSGIENEVVLSRKLLLKISLNDMGFIPFNYVLIK